MNRGAEIVPKIEVMYRVVTTEDILISMVSSDYAVYSIYTILYTVNTRDPGYQQTCLLN